MIRLEIPLSECKEAGLGRTVAVIFLPHTLIHARNGPIRRDLGNRKWSSSGDKMGHEVGTLGTVFIDERVIDRIEGRLAEDEEATS